MNKLGPGDVPTDKQAELLGYIKERLAADGFPPTVRQMAGRFGITTNAILCRLLGLEKRGLIRRDAGSARAIRILERAS